MKDLCIVVPIYSHDISAIDRVSLLQLSKKCPEKYDIYLMHPSSWTNEDLIPYIEILKNAKSIKFDDKYFESPFSYSDLLKDVTFYEAFSDYKYMLIYQTDCYAMDMSKLDEWIEMDFDYVGAPIISNKKHWKSSPCCGNGGLSLRKISKFISICKNAELREELDKNDIYKNWEDTYFCEGVAQHIFMDMPTWEEAAEFAWDMNPDVLYNRHHFSLPQIGCHAWPKNIPFWKDHLDIPEDAIKEAYEKHKVFIGIYYAS